MNLLKIIIPLYWYCLSIVTFYIATQMPQHFLSLLLLGTFVFFIAIVETLRMINN